MDKLVKHRKDLIIEAIGYVTSNAVELLKEEVLKVWVAFLSVLTSFNISQYYV